MAKNRIYSDVPVKTLARSFVTYDKEFGFDPGKQGSREAALQAAENHGAAVQRAFETRLGRPLSVREKLTLKKDEPKPEPYSGSLRKDRPITNPFRDRMAEVSSWSEVHQFQRDRKRRRVEALEKQADAWDAKQAAVERDAARTASPDYVRAHKHASDRYAALLLDSDVTQEVVQAASDAIKNLEAGQSPGSYFQSIQQPLPSPGSEQ